MHASTTTPALGVFVSNASMPVTLDRRRPCARARIAPGRVACARSRTLFQLSQLVPRRPPMRAALFTETGADLTIEDIEPSPPGPRDVVVELGASGVCHSDLSLKNGYV